MKYIGECRDRMKQIVEFRDRMKDIVECRWQERDCGVKVSERYFGMPMTV
jgi:hypothetical protein